MMDRTDRHFRYLVRQLTRRTLLYTEMITAGAVLHGDRAHLLGFSPEERPLALQLGGDDPKSLAECAKIAEGFGYDEVNLNVGCPSDRVQSGRFGACLMDHPGRVADAVYAMRAAAQLPVTVKHRIGVDDRDRYEDMARFVDIVAAAGCDRFTVHARAAWLKGLSPKENREIPPLRYEEVYRLKRERPGLAVELNGGVTTLAAAQGHLGAVDAVMIGRAAYDDPCLFATADRELFGEQAAAKTREEVVWAMVPYAARHIAAGGRLHSIARHMFGLYSNRPGAGVWRRSLGELAARPDAPAEALLEALSRAEDAARRAAERRAAS
jgi:tRNA-dihydrouridine synthase A